LAGAAEVIANMYDGSLLAGESGLEFSFNLPNGGGWAGVEGDEPSGCQPQLERNLGPPESAISNIRPTIGRPIEVGQLRVEMENGCEKDGLQEIGMLAGEGHTNLLIGRGAAAGLHKLGKKTLDCGFFVLVSSR
jgi:hypothetical protein